MSKILIAYYSYSGNTRKVARQIQKIVGGDLFEIQPVDDYPENYNACVEQAKKEIAEGYRPSLVGKLDDIGQYDTVFLGSPVWWYTVAPPVMTFLSEHDFSGKEISPFCTHGGSGLSKCQTDIAKACPKATVLNALALWGNKIGASHKELADWLHRIELK